MDHDHGPLSVVIVHRRQQQHHHHRNGTAVASARKHLNELAAGRRWLAHPHIIDRIEHDASRCMMPTFAGVEASPAVAAHGTGVASARKHMIELAADRRWLVHPSTINIIDEIEQHIPFPSFLIMPSLRNSQYRSVRQ